jgi:hypothetical protein
LEPTSPGKPVILAIGFVVSLAAGLAVAVGVSALSQKVWTYQELERSLEVPVLIEIPSMNTPKDTRLEFRRTLAHTLLFLLCTGAYLGGIYYLYRSQSSALRLLNPIIEKIEERTAN